MWKPTQIALELRPGAWPAAYALAWLVASMATSVFAQVEHTLPTVPQEPPRPEVSGEGWKYEQDGDRSLSTFMQPVTSNDAVVRVTVGQGRTLTAKSPIATGDGTAFVAVGDPTIVDFEVLRNPRMIRIVGQRAGVTDLVITTSDGETYSFEVEVGYDLPLLRAKLSQLFPDASINITQLREHLIVEGEARSPQQVATIVAILQNHIRSIQTPRELKTEERSRIEESLKKRFGLDDTETPDEGEAYVENNVRPDYKLILPNPQVINLLRVPGVQQVMLQVRIAELNRTALRQVGADVLKVSPNSGNIVGTRIAGSLFSLTASGSAGSVSANSFSPSATAFGIFPSGDWQILMNLLRSNKVVNILAEPNLVALSGQRASFLAGGQFPIPVSQVTGTSSTVTVVFKDFGVSLNFIPYIQDDGVIRLHVAPEVSSIDFNLGTTLVPGGEITPGLNTRKAETTVEMRQGQTLAMAGLLEVDLEAQTDRVPGLGDLPYIGPLFSNTSHERVEKELVVLVTPMLVAPMDTCDVGPLPGADITDPNDKELYLLNRIEGRTGRQHRSTTAWDNPLGLVETLELQHKCTCGNVGFSH